MDADDGGLTTMRPVESEEKIAVLCHILYASFGLACRGPSGEPSRHKPQSWCGWLWWTCGGWPPGRGTGWAMATGCQVGMSE